VPDQAAFRVDFPAWLARLSRRDLRIAERLAAGRSTSEVARQVGLSAARISQKRHELHASWQAFQGDATVRS